MGKKDMQKEMLKLVDQLKVNLQKIGKDAGVAAKKGEKELVRASSIGKLQLDMVKMNLQKEKIYYDIGKKVASQRGTNNAVPENIKPLLQKLRKIETENRKKKREISAIKKGKNKK